LSFFGKLASHEEQLRESILRNLEAILNAKRGYSAAVEVFGLGRADGYFAKRPLVEGLVRDMLEVIRCHEPRLGSPSLSLVGRDHDLWVNFELFGTVSGAPCVFVIRFHCVFRNVQVSLA
jgi:predicted component of type VI protein secretion system